MDCEKNYYELLGVERDASTEQIKEAYKEIARVYHPDSQFYSELTDDRPTDDQVNVFKVLTAAYHTLTNSSKRAAYDQTLAPELPDWEEPVDEDAEILEALEKLGVEPEAVGMKPKPKVRQRKNSAAFGIFGNVAAAEEDMKMRGDSPAQFNKTAFGHGQYGMARNRKSTLTGLVRPNLEDDYEPVAPPTRSSSKQPSMRGGATTGENDKIQKLLVIFAITGSFCFAASIAAFLMLN